jgi:hypothetical protein
MEAIRSSETSVHTRFAQRHIPVEGILHSHRCETLKSDNANIQEFNHNVYNNTPKFTLCQYKYEGADKSLAL